MHFRAEVDDKRGVVIIVEDSGAGKLCRAHFLTQCSSFSITHKRTIASLILGVPEDKRNKLFNKFQESLDSLHQGTG